MTAQEIYQRLKEIAPLVAFDSSREHDSYFSWDGDGPDPRDSGYDPYDVTVSATTIINGETAIGESYLGGSYYRQDEPIDDIHGYLPQKLEEAALELRDQLPKDHPAMSQCDDVLDFLDREMRQRYIEQRKLLEHERSSG